MSLRHPSKCYKKRHKIWLKLQLINCFLNKSLLARVYQVFIIKIAEVWTAAEPFVTPAKQVTKTEPELRPPNPYLIRPAERGTDANKHVG